MKKSLFVAAVAALAMASCSKDEQTGINPNRNGQAIDFRAAMGTRATEMKTSDLETIFVTAIDASGQNYFTDVQFDKKTENSATYFSSAPNLYYWPGDGSTLDFYAYSPSIEDLGNANLTISDGDKKLVDFSPNADIAKQVDFITAHNTGDKSDATNGVELSFKHQLAQIGITAKNSGKTYKYTIKGVELRNILNTGTFEFANGEWATKVTNWANAESGDLSTYTFDVSETVLGENYTNLAQSNAMLIPQTLVALAGTVSNGAYIAVNVKIETDGGAVVRDGWVAAPIDTKWANGYKYIYQLDFSSGAGVDPENPEIPILGDPIIFKVTVTEWNDANDLSDIIM